MVVDMGVSVSVRQVVLADLFQREETMVQPVQGHEVFLLVLRYGLGSCYLSLEGRSVSLILCTIDNK